MFEVNVVGLIAATQAFSPLLVNAAVAKEKSLVLNVGSTASVGLPWMGIYSASKVCTNLLASATVLIFHVRRLRMRSLTF